MTPGWLLPSGEGGKEDQDEGKAVAVHIGTKTRDQISDGLPDASDGDRKCNGEGIGKLADMVPKGEKDDRDGNRNGTE